MPAVPKKKHTRARKGGRDAHSALKKPQYRECGNAACDALVVPHRACAACGYYNGRFVAGFGAEA